MKQVVQDIRTGTTSVADVPSPRGASRDVVVEVMASAISAGTERYVVDLAKMSLLEKARSRPDHVRRVLQKIRQEGLRSTMTQVRAKLDEPMPLGYSAAGVVLDCGSAIRRFRPGDRVAVAAPHAGVVAAGEHLCAAIPDGVSFEDAAYAGIASIAMQGVRLSRVTLGERVLVIGTGLIGLMTIALLRVQGCRVYATDITDRWFDRARALGADGAGLDSPSEQVRAFARGEGVDAVIITAATPSNEPIEFAADMCRRKGRIVLVGVVGLHVPRAPFFEKELEFTVSSSMGPGRGDARYEEQGIDYPIGYVRWTMQRNMEAVLDQMAFGAMPAASLTTHRFSIEAAADAYELLTSRREACLGIVLAYSERSREQTSAIVQDRRSTATGTRLSLLGAGNFGRLILLPLLAKAQGIALRGVVTAKGLTATHVASQYHFDFSSSNPSDVIEDESTDAVFVLTRHAQHGDMVEAAIRAGKHVFVEKPLCLTVGELRRIAQALDAQPSSLLMVGFNRRFSPSLAHVRAHFQGVAPLSVMYRFAVPEIPESSWVQDPEIGGGRIIGEACHAVDACIAITGSPVTRVFTESVAARGAVRTPDDRVFITMTHENGSVSSISYQAGGASAGPRERIEVFGGGRSAFMDDFDRIELWKGTGGERRSGGREKGHAAELEAFFRACREGGAWPIPWPQIESSTWAAIAAVESLRVGMPIDRSTLLP